MDRGAGAIKRFATATLVLIAFVSGTGAHAEGPEDEVRELLLRAENVFAVGVTPQNILVAWDNPSLIPGVRWRVEVSEDEVGPYVRISDAPQCAPKCVALVSPGTVPADLVPRFFRVVPILGIETTSILEGRPSEPYPAILGPFRPTQLRCNGGLACLQVQSITLTWVDNSDEVEFWIMRARGAVNPQFGTTPHAVVPANTTTYSETIPDFNTVYSYKVVAVRRVSVPRIDGSVTVVESYADSVTGTNPDGGILPAPGVKIETPPIPPPADPSGLTAVFIPPSTARLTWTDNAIDEDGFYVEWKDPDADTTEFQLQMPTPAKDGVGTMMWEDKELPPDTARCFRVRAWKLGPAYSGYTNTACLGSTPIAPTGLTAQVISNSQVDLKWKDNSNAEDSYLVERCPGTCTHGSSNWAQIAGLPADTEEFSDTNTVALTTYSYRVFASNMSGRSPPSNIRTVTTLKAPLAAPTNLTAEGIRSRRIKLTWKDNTSNETGFRIEYETPDGWQTLDHVGPKAGSGGTVEYIDMQSLTPNTQRCYRVRAVRGSLEESDPTARRCATTLPPQAPNGKPTNLIATAVFDRRVDLRWRDNSTNEDKFRIETIRFPDKHCSGQSITGLPWTEIATAPERDQPDPGPVNFTVTGLQPHTAHFFRVIAVNLDGESDPSNVLGCVETLGPSIPEWLDPTENGSTSVTRCNVRIIAPIFENGDVHTNKMTLKILPSIPGGPPYDVIDRELTRQPGQQPHGRVTPDPDGNGRDVWQFNYQFRRGIAYGLIAQAIGDTPTEYKSELARLRDITVFADCPQSGL